MNDLAGMLWYDGFDRNFETVFCSNVSYSNFGK